MPIDVLLQATTQGLLMGSIYALVALSLTLIFAVGGLLNFAHGDFMVLAMYAAFAVLAALGVDPYLLAVPLFGLFFLVGTGVFRGLVRPVLSSGLLVGAQLTLGMVFVLQNAMLLIFGGDHLSVPTVLSNRNVSFGTVILPLPLLVASAVAAIMSIFLYVLLMRTDFGRQVRAVRQNRDAAALMGIPIVRVQAKAFGLGIGLLGLTGAFLVAQFTLTPSMGLDLTLLALIVMVFGGIGNFLGCLGGGLIIGVIEGLGTLFFGGTVGAMAPYVALVLVLLLRPHGLFGEH